MNASAFDRDALPRGAIKRFREHLNTVCADENYRNGRYAQKKRGYGDYLYAQDRDKFFVEMEICVENGSFAL